VNAMLAKVILPKPHDWSKVKAICDAVIAGGYTLLPSYDNLWDNTNENSAESIFEIIAMVGHRRELGHIYVLRNGLEEI